MSFHENLQSYRKKNKLSQETLAERLGVSRQSVAKWEGGRCYPDIDKLVMISDFFKVSLDDLIKNKENDACCNFKNNITRMGEYKMDKKIIEFLCRAKGETYASGKATQIIASRPNSHDYEYTEGNLRYIDTYLGGERFSGEEGLWKDNVPFWSMNYIGRVLNEEFEGKFLKEALKQVPKEYPYRGPLSYRNGQFKYECSVQGDFGWFIGEECIYKNDVKVYECRFHGGIVI